MTSVLAGLCSTMGILIITIMQGVDAFDTCDTFQSGKFIGPLEQRNPMHVLHQTYLQYCNGDIAILFEASPNSEDHAHRDFGVGEHLKPFCLAKRNGISSFKHAFRCKRETRHDQEIEILTYGDTAEKCENILMEVRLLNAVAARYKHEKKATDVRVVCSMAIHIDERIMEPLGRKILLERQLTLLGYSTKVSPLKAPGVEMERRCNRTFLCKLFSPSITISHSGSVLTIARYANILTAGECHQSGVYCNVSGFLRLNPCGQTTSALSMALSLVIAVTMCFSALGNLVLAPTGTQNSSKERQYTSKLVTMLKNKFRRLPLLSKQRGSSRTTLRLLLLLFLGNFALPSSSEGTNLRKSITDGNIECLQYNSETRLFLMTCDVLEWKWNSTYISLGANETFDGGAPDAKGIIDLAGIENFEGLFTVQDDVQSFAEAPLIQNVHVKNGTTAEKGGFIVQKEQRYFIVDSCSSAGDIENVDSGGICGWSSGYKGEIKISNCYSTGTVKGDDAGGIAGDRVGREGIARITQCHSTGDMKGNYVGGICGWGAGSYNGRLNITKSYSTGDILGQWSGGITGGSTGLNGSVYIRESYTKGKISGKYSGGICGAVAARYHGEVHIWDCYSRGVIEGKSYAGGISGRWTGWDGGAVYIENTYASGSIDDPNAGGIIGHIASSRDIVDVKYSVYNHSDTSKIAGAGDGSFLTTNMGNSHDLNDIMGQLYKFDGIQQWSNDTWAVNGTQKLPILKFQLPENREQQKPTSSPSPTATCASSPTKSPSELVTPTATTTCTPSRTKSDSSSVTRNPETNGNNSTDLGSKLHSVRVKSRSKPMYLPVRPVTCKRHG